MTAPHEFRLIADSAPVPMWLTGLDRRRRFVNRAYLDFLGIDYAAAVDFDWRTILHPDDHDRIVRESIAGEASLRPFTLEGRYRRHDGEWRWLHSVSQPSFDEAGRHNGFIGVVFDLTEAKAAEQALQQRERRLAAYVSQSAAGFGEVDPSGRFTEVNDRFCEISGYSREELLALTVESITHPDDWPRNAPLFEAAVAHGTPYTHDKRYVRPDGSIVWVNNSVSTIYDAQGSLTGVLAVSIDITARKHAEAQLRDTEERLRLATEAAGIGTWEWDLSQLHATWSDETWRIIGLNRAAEVTARDHADSIHPDDRAAARAAANDGIRRNGRFSSEYRIVRPDGEVRWVEARGLALPGSDGEPARTIGTLRDITDRKRAQARLEELNRDLEAAVAERTRERDGMWRLSRDLLMVLDPRLRILAVNPIVEELTGYSPDEVLGGRLSRFVHPHDWPAVVEAIRRGRREPVRDIEARLVTRDGEVRDFVWNAAPEEGRAYVSGRDLTAEKQRLAELLAAQEALRQSQKLEAIGQLTGGVAHDFNNLLSPIIGGLDLLRRRGVGGEREQRLIEGALQSADRARVLVQRLLAFARRQPLQVSEVPLGPLLGELQGLLHSTLGPQVELEIVAAPGLPPVLADPNQLEMALINLAVNARDAIHARGGQRGRLRIAAAQATAADQAATCPDEGFVEITIDDDGIGMDEATLARATEPFFSSKGVGQGTGLGLSMVEGLTAQLGGAMRIDSTPGQGTTVTMCLPIAALAPADVPLRKPEPAALPRPHGRVLVVDDEPLVRLGTAEMLRDYGFTVDECATGEQALEVVNQRDAAYDCVVTDYLMPGMNGVEFARRLRLLRPALPVLLLSGYAEPETLGSELPYLSKPCLGDELARTIAALVAAAPASAAPPRDDAAPGP